MLTLTSGFVETGVRVRSSKQRKRAARAMKDGALLYGPKVCQMIVVDQGDDWHAAKSSNDIPEKSTPTTTEAPAKPIIKEGDTIDTSTLETRIKMLEEELKIHKELCTRISVDKFTELQLENKRLEERIAKLEEENKNLKRKWEDEGNKSQSPGSGFQEFSEGFVSVNVDEQKDSPTKDVAQPTKRRRLTLRRKYVESEDHSEDGKNVDEYENKETKDNSSAKDADQKKQEEEEKKETKDNSSEEPKSAKEAEQKKQKEGSQQPEKIAEEEGQKKPRRRLKKKTMEEPKIGSIEKNVKKRREEKHKMSKFIGFEHFKTKEAKEIVHHFMDNIEKMLKREWKFSEDTWCTGKDLAALLYKDQMTHSPVLDCFVQMLKESTSKRRKKGLTWHCMSTYAPQKLSFNIEDIILEQIDMLSPLFNVPMKDWDAMDSVFTILNNDNHWHLYEASFRDGAHRSYNSMSWSSNSRKEFNRWVGIVHDFFRGAPEKGSQLSQWKRDYPICPQQEEDSLDCGIFVMKYLECLVNCKPMDFTCKDIPSIRADIFQRMMARGQLQPPKDDEKAEIEEMKEGISADNNGGEAEADKQPETKKNEETTSV